MKLEKLQVYQLAMEMAEQIWGIVLKWDYFAKDTIGKQLVRAADSVAANLSEGLRTLLLQRKSSVLLLQSRLSL